MVKNAELIVDAKAFLAEGPCWDYDSNLLYWVDIEGKKLHVFNPYTDTDKQIDVGQRIGTMAVAKDGRIIAALENGLYFLDFKNGELEFICNPESDKPKNRFNDGKCDPAGRFWCGTMKKEGERGPVGALYCFDTDKTVRTMVTGVCISNGLAWSPDNKTMYYIDTVTRQVAAFDYDIKDGSISNRRVAIDFAEEKGSPDGMTIDEEGMLWIAHWGGYQVGRWNPETGKKIDMVKMPVAHVSCCVFGGENMDELYITTAREGLSQEQLKEQPTAGGVYKVKTDVVGCKSYKFGR